MLIGLGIVVVALAAVLALVWFERSSHDWGASAEEVAMPLTGDDWLEGGPPARTRMTRAVWIEAPAEKVWPWLAQLGRGAGWYSYDRLDNGGRRSARHIVGWIPEPRPGDGAVIGYLRQLEPGREIVWWLRGTRFLGSWFRGAMLYRVTGEGERSRLVARFQADVEGGIAPLACWLFCCIDGFMARRQLVGVKERAERLGDRGADPDRPETGARDQYQLYQAVYAAGGEAGASGRRDGAEWRRHAVEDGVIGPDAERPPR